MGQVPSQPAASNGSTPQAQTPHAPADDREEVYFSGPPALRGHLSLLLGWGLVGVVLIALPIAAAILEWHWMHWWARLVLIVVGLAVFFIPAWVTHATHYIISNYRIDYERGLLSRKIDTLELWHVEDIQFDQSLCDRLLNVGTIIVISHDESTPQLNMRGLPNPRPLFESLKQRIIAVKRQRGVIKMDGV